MTTVVNKNKACCSIPPVSHEYDAKGEYKAYGGMDKVYMTGPMRTGKTIIVVYDIFGYFPQTLQGADILAETVQARVIMPDFLLGKPYPVDKYPPKDEAEEAELQTYFATTADPDTTLPYVKGIGEAVKKDGAAKIGILGYCWGGNLAVSVGDQPWINAIATVHPSMISASDADVIKVPLALFPCEEDEMEDFQALYEALSTKPFASKNVWKVYDTVHHGFAAARAKLTDPEYKAQYEDVYARLATFFNDVFQS